MGRPTESARLKKWRGQWYLFFTDHNTGRKVRKSCHGLGASTPKARRALVKQYRAIEVDSEIETLRRGWRVSPDAVLIEDIDLYIEYCRERAEMRDANPEARAGLSARTMLRIEDTVGHFKKWLESTNRGQFLSADLDANILDAYFRHVVKEGTRNGERRTKRTAATVNIYKRNVKACLRWLQRQRPRRFVDLEELTAMCRPLRTMRKMPAVFAPDALASFFKSALAYEDPNRVVQVRSPDRGRKRAPYLQPAAAKSSTPVSRLFILLALSGCRLGEALALEWDDIDLERGRIIVRAGKTGMLRWIPLKGATEGEVAPELVKLLQRWRAERPEAKFVLPHGKLPVPVFPKRAWKAVAVSSTAPSLMPQRLRQNFTSYAASLGIPPAVAAMWQGHSTDVAERHYRAQVLDRVSGALSIEEAMGLSGLIRSMVSETEPMNDDGDGR